MDLADRLELGSRLRQLRESTGKTTLEIAEQVLGYSGSHAAVSRLERGVFAQVNLGHLQKLATFYGTTTPALLKGTGDVESTELPEVTGTWSEADIRPGLAGRLRDMRQALGLTMPQMAAQLGFTPTYAVSIRAWESGKAVPVPDTLLKIATAFGVSSSWLILGAKGKASQPTQSMRLRALRHLSGKSRIQVAMAADSQDFTSMRSSLSKAETSGEPLPVDKLAAVAKAFDVPMSFLDPQGLRFRPEEVAQHDRAGGIAAHVPSTVRKLIEQILAMHETGLLDTSDIADLLKQMSRRAYGRSANASA